MEEQKKDKGITLIALVITIIVLLILAGVSIAMLTGENGILSQAQKASEQTEIASEEERVNLAASGALLKDDGLKIIQTNLEEELKKYFNENDFSVTTGTNDSGEEGFIVTITENIEEGRKYFVNQNGGIEEYKEPQVSELTDIYVTLYTDGTLGFSNNNQTIEGKTVEASYGNIKDKVLEIDEDLQVPNFPWFELDSITNMEELQNQIAKIKKIDIANKIVPQNTSMWFSMLSNLQEIEHLENLDTSNVTDMSYMFDMCSNLSSIDLSGLNTSNVTNMSYMFDMCSNLSSIDLSGLNTSNVTDISFMFAGCSSLNSINLSNLKTNNVTNMQGFLLMCEELTTVNLSSFNTSNVTNMDSMFYQCRGLTSLDLSNFNTSKVTDMMGMFQYCSSLKNVDLSSFNTENVINMNQMFFECNNLESLDISSFNISEDTDITNLFTASYSGVDYTVYVKNEEIRNILKAESVNQNVTIEVKS